MTYQPIEARQGRTRGIGQRTALNPVRASLGRGKLPGQGGQALPVPVTLQLISGDGEISAHEERRIVLNWQSGDQEFKCEAKWA